MFDPNEMRDLIIIVFFLLLLLILLALMKKRLWEFFDFYFANKKLEIDFNSSIKKCFLSVLYQKRFKRERKMRSKMQDQMESELRKRSQIEEILKASNAPEAALRILAGKYIILVS